MCGARCSQFDSVVSLDSVGRWHQTDHRYGLAGRLKHDGLFGSCAGSAILLGDGTWVDGASIGGGEPFHPASEMPDHVRGQPMWDTGPRGMLGYVSI